LRCTPEGTARVATLSDGIDSAESLRGLYGLIGCVYGEVVSLADDLHMWLDEEGLLHRPQLPLNRPAMRMAAEFDRTRACVGTVVFTGGADASGVTLGLSDERLRWLLGQLERFGVTSVNSLREVTCDYVRPEGA
jgi:hypothetical protein